MRAPQTHHPGWFYILWDRVACEQLLEKRYPWFLDTWKLLGQDKGSIVLQSGTCTLGDACKL